MNASAGTWFVLLERASWQLKKLAEIVEGANPAAFPIYPHKRLEEVRKLQEDLSKVNLLSPTGFMPNDADPLWRAREMLADRERLEAVKRDLVKAGFSIVADALDLARPIPTPTGLCVYEARSRDGTWKGRAHGGAEEVWCRVHGFDCPNTIAQPGAKP